MELINLSQSNFQENIQNGTWLIQFWSSWCGPCINTSHLEEFQLVSPGITVARINSEENQNLATRYSVNVVPTYILFKKGNPIKRLVGLQTKETLRDLITSD